MIQLAGNEARKSPCYTMPEMERAYFSSTWAGHRWSAWMPLLAAHPLALAQLPSYAGIYRVRQVGQEDLLWIGAAERGVRETVERLSRQVHLPVPPYDDPAQPARRLWQLQRQGGSFEVSGVVWRGSLSQEVYRLRALYDVMHGQPMGM